MITTNERFFENKNVYFHFDIVKKEITGHCLKDMYNMPKCYNITSRSFKKALSNMEMFFDENVTMYSGMDIIENAKIKMRSYCSMD